MVRGTGLEPVTPTVSRWCSTTELTALVIRSGPKNTQLFALMAMLFFDSEHFVTAWKEKFLKQRIKIVYTHVILTRNALHGGSE